MYSVVNRNNGIELYKSMSSKGCSFLVQMDSYKLDGYQTLQNVFLFYTLKI